MRHAVLRLVPLASVLKPLLGCSTASDPATSDRRKRELRMKLGTDLESTNALCRTRESSGPRDAKSVQLLCSRDATCSRLSIVRFDTGPKRSIRHLLGGEKNNFFNSRYCRSRHDGRVDGILSIGGAEVSRGSLGVGSRRAQAPTPHAPALQAFLTEISQQTREL